jgi:hypothetical protein
LLVCQPEAIYALLKGVALGARTRAIEKVVHGRRIGAITPEELEDTLKHIFGKRGWQTAFARGTGFAQSTIGRYVSGRYPIPQHVALIVKMLATLRNNRLPVPEDFNIETGWER